MPSVAKINSTEIANLREQIVEMVGEMATCETGNRSSRTETLAQLVALCGHPDASHNDTRISLELYKFIADKGQQKICSYIKNWEQAAWLATLLTRTNSLSRN